MTPQQEHNIEVAVQLFNNNCDLQNLEQVGNILLALKKFIDINKSFSDRTDVILPRVFSFIALCNYKMDNQDRAYWCAKKSVELGEAAMENSVFVSDVNLYLDQQVFALIKELEQNHADEIDFERGYQEGEENIFDDSKIQSLLRQVRDSGSNTLSKENIKILIEVLNKFHENASKFFEAQGDGLQAFQYGQMIEMFKMPLYCAWQLYKYGWHTDFMKEGDSLFPYMMFESKAIEMLTDLIKLLETESPFTLLERNGAVTKGLLQIYHQMIADLKSGKIEIK